MEPSSTDRIIVLVDMDCFYVQVEQKLCPQFQNMPCAVVQYKTWKGGGIIAVNYEARAKGVTRLLRGDEAQEKCPEIHLFRVPEVRGKADLTRYREAGALVIDVLCEYSDCVERASIDEAYLDMTSAISSRIQNTPPVTVDQLPNTFVIGWEGKDPDTRKSELHKWLQMIYEEEHLYHDRMLAVTAVIVEEMREAVYQKTGFRCSAGIAHNKMLAKLSCGINKPNKQTVLPQSSIQLLFKTIPIKKVRNLGGKLGGAIVKKFNVENMGDLIDVPKSQFANQFGEKTGNWLYNLVRGIENEPVTSRQLPKSIGCGKNFPGKSSLSTRQDVVHWLNQLACELEERLIKDQNTNKRFARLLTVSVRNDSNGYSHVSRSCPIHIYNAEKLAHDALAAISKLNTSSSEVLWKPSIYTLSMAASKFEDRLDKSYCSIQSYLINSKSSEKNDSIINEGESTSSTSTASISAGGSDIRTDQSLNTSVSKTEKNSSYSNHSITSFFTRKQIDKIESVDNLASANTIEVQDLDIEGDKNSDFLVKDDEDGCMIGNKCSDVEKTCTEVSSEGVIEGMIGNKCTDVEKTCTEESFEDLIGKQPKPLGFFAKKLAERIEFNFDIEFETSCDGDDITNEQVIGENNLALAQTDDKSIPSTSSMLNICSNLDPELTKLCDQCNKLIPVWEEAEHLDYHFAVNLSKELRKPVIKDSIVSKSSSIDKSTAANKSRGRGRKRGNATKSSSQAKRLVQKNTLDAFIK